MRKNIKQVLNATLKKKFDDTDIIVFPWPILYWRFTENQGLLVLVQPVCVFQTYELLLQQYFWLTVEYILLNYLKTISYIHMADKSQAFLSVQSCFFFLSLHTSTIIRTLSALYLMRMGNFVLKNCVCF